MTPGLVKRGRSGNWDPDDNEADRQSRDALAARGYWQAFQLVRETVGEVIGDANPGVLVRDAMPTLFDLLEKETVPPVLVRTSGRLQDSWRSRLRVHRSRWDKSAKVGREISSGRARNTNYQLLVFGLRGNR